MLNFLPGLSLINVIDILLVSFIIFWLLLLIRNTRAEQLVRGLLVLLGAGLVSRWLGLYTITFILDSIQTMVLVAIPVVFQPELRRALEQLGRGRFFRPAVFFQEEEGERALAEIVRAVDDLSRRRIGALLVIQGRTGLEEVAETGVRIDGRVSGELLLSIFLPGSPLHDGAVLLQDGRVVAAGCLLPLTEQRLSNELGTRHRAALGITEVSDAVAVVVSEETGAISLAREGRLVRGLSADELRKELRRKEKPGAGFWVRWRDGR